MLYEVITGRPNAPCCFSSAVTILKAAKIFPNVIPSIVVVFSINIADAILTEAGLSFIGLGLPVITSYSIHYTKLYDAGQDIDSLQEPYRSDQQQ